MNMVWQAQIFGRYHYYVTTIVLSR